MPTFVEYPCERCGVTVQRQVGDEGRARFCSIRCGRLAQQMATREERFWAKVRKTDDCWEWTGTCAPFGYGVLYSGPRGQVHSEVAHRVSWELHFGPIPAGLNVCHHCDNPPCVRPDHLFVGTQADNVRDRDAKGRHWTHRGMLVGTAKLTDAQVRDMRVRRSEGALLREIAVEFGTSVGNVQTIVTRHSWRHVE